MPPKNDVTYLQHMLEWSHTAMTSCEGMSVADIREDLPAQSVLIRALQTIGDAANNISSELRSRYPEVPWRSMIDMRNFLVHAYWDIDTSIVWITATEKVPELVPQLEAILAIERTRNKEI